ncbi:hypothetical protein ASD64_09080 [Mesorhizobium sp. Root157]|uniref:hypothetical protein n=1 Tax=Mesorhizobium sp. Root157 TaxID=1736477 RepID=UPI0006FC8E2A|nr:hypothetical protein [Mesorhizobium sp. Root157]KQZ81898.1 hypothetical protein ASD64_09080 [Mesorhizobium sp. Root157]
MRFGLASSALGFDERCFRFSVRCDRDMSTRIEAAARKAGVSPTTFVQQHFDTIFDDPADETGFVPQKFARHHNVSVQAARLWQAMATQASADRTITGAAREFCAAAKVSQGRASEHLAELVTAGLVTVLRKPVSAQAGRYRIERGGAK